MSDTEVKIGDFPGENDKIDNLSEINEKDADDVRVTENIIDGEKIEGKEFGVFMDKDGGVVFGSNSDVNVTENAKYDEKNEFVELMDETLVGDGNVGGVVFGTNSDVITENIKYDEKNDFGDFMDETLVGDGNDGGVVFGSSFDVRVTENIVAYEKDEGEEGGGAMDETLVENYEGLDGNIVKIVGEEEKTEGEEYGASVDETLVENNDDLCGKYEKIEGDGGVVFELNTDVRVTDSYTENEKIEGEKFGDAMDETELGKNDGLSGDVGVGLETNSGVSEDEEDEGSFFVTDLVWGKVRSHPWWPGQIFNPSDSSGKAQKHSKKDGFLIAYFGDQTFAFNEPAKIKPFKEHFVNMEKQSKAEAFCDAMDCALGEVSRRVEYGLACKCLSDDVYDKIKTQRIVNAGIRKESSEREGGDVSGDFGGESFVPLDLVSYMEGLAKNPCGRTGRLDFVTARAQLLAFNRHKGFNELPEVQMFGELSSAEKDGDVPLGKHKGIKEGFKKRKKIASDSVAPKERERIKAGGDATLPSSKKVKVDTNITDDKMVEEKTDLSLETTKKGFSNIGKRICSVIPALKDGGDGSILSSGKKRGRKKVIKAEKLSPDEIFIHLCAMARDPIKGYSSLGSIISFFSDMKNQLSLEISEQEKSNDKSPKKEGGEGLSDEFMGDFVVEGFEDSYWTDRLVVGDVQEQVLFEPEIPDENSTNPETQIGNEVASVESDPKAETGDDVYIETDNDVDMEAGVDVDMETDNDVNMEAGDHVNIEIGDNNNLGTGDHVSDGKCNPTALILNFTDLDSVPSQNELNNIFRRYGPLKETGTEVIKKSKRAKVIFKRRVDAETAFSSSGKFSIFGPSLVSYRLHYLPTKQDSVSPAKKRSKKGAKSAEVNDA